MGEFAFCELGDGAELLKADAGGPARCAAGDAGVEPFTTALSGVDAA